MSRATGTFIIAEAGVNHNGSLELALELVRAARDCGADAIKFQTFSADRLVTRAAEKAAYQQRSLPDDNSQYRMLKALELSEQDFIALRDECGRQGIEFLSSAFDAESADFLHRLGMRLFKIPSGEVTNMPLLWHIGAFGKSIILSTGMCWLADVETAVRALRDAGGGPITVLHCVTEYPAPDDQINLSAMETLKHALGLPVGYSDHTSGIHIPVAAVGMGATVIEKHFTLDTAMEGPDHAASLAPDAFRDMVRAIRGVEAALGDGRKQPAPCEMANAEVARKSIVVDRPIAAGEIIAPEHLAMKRPGTGISPTLLEQVLGRRARRDLQPDTVLDWTDLQ